MMYRRAVQSAADFRYSKIGKEQELFANARVAFEYF
jgi:hypothetical protein